MRVESGDIRYPHFSGDNQTDCTRPFFENGLGPRLVYTVLEDTSAFTPRQGSKILPLQMLLNREISLIRSTITWQLWDSVVASIYLCSSVFLALILTAEGEQLNQVLLKSVKHPTIAVDELRLQPFSTSTSGTY